MGLITGETLTLKQSERVELERLSRRRSGAKQIISPALAKLGAELSFKLGRQLGLLIERKGDIESIILGSKNRLYLPDIGRYRLGAGRLRRLRLVVFMPPGSFKMSRQPQTFSLSSSEDYPNESLIKTDERQILAPVIPQDYITDLQKLRLDCLLAVGVSDTGEPLSASAVHLEPVTDAEHPFVRSSKIVSGQLSFLQFRSIFDIDVDLEALLADLEKRLGAVTQKSFQTAKDRALVVGVYTGTYQEESYAIAELLELARTASVEVVDTVVQRRKAIDPKTIIGKGKVEELALHALELEADLLIFDRELTPSQLRNITKVTELRVVDRSMLILDIFAQRAKTREGRLQVELAQLKYSLPRLTDQDTGLSRLTGGIGGRGPGETKLEIGRRRTRDRITELEKRIEDIADQRGLRRSRRQQRGVPVIAIVGYTNAGKSTLLNALTKGDVFVENKLFATLDPSSRRMRFPNEKEIVLVDTVGFIRELPDELVSAFRATLEEVGEADLLLQVVDASSPDAAMQAQVVMQTLEELGFGHKPRITVLNKIDLLSAIESESLKNAFGDCVLVSAAQRLGLEALLEKSQQMLIESFAGQDPGGVLFDSTYHL